MKDHQTIFSKKELKNKVKSAFPAAIPQMKEKIKIVETWQESIFSGKIMNAKEETIKPQFLFAFFGQILGYEYENSNTWNLQLENKTDYDSTKSDAALGFFKIKDNQELTKDVRTVIEIKNARSVLDNQQNRPDFRGNAVEQGFMYAAKSSEKCKWVIISNFLEIRLYLAGDMTKYEDFDIVSLNDNYEFSRFYYLLANGQLFYENTESQIDILLSNRIEHEKKITKEFYNKYKYLREIFVQHLKLHNPSENQLDLLQYAQTIIDRILFISVIKDYNLINYHVLNEIENFATKSWVDDNSEIWRQLTLFFKALDKGMPQRVSKFNGGLFRYDEAINKLIIKDVFLKQLLTLNTYDFESDLNVNILGHIFEQSITDIENLKRDLSENIFGEYSETETEIIYHPLDIESNKRKKEGIYYTPEKITQYIINQAIGSWLQKQKEEIGITNLSNFPTNEEEKNVHVQLWKKYADALRKIKILDPACGSGAFLTQSFDFLLHEWTTVLEVFVKLNAKPEKQNQLQKIGLFANEINEDAKSISQIKKEIVNNNLFGVDLNSESVEITKLGLWLKSASKNDPLALLDKNIKCGNSLISDKNISEKAFVWESEFKEIMESGGFDVVIGNPPYVSTKIINENEKVYFTKNYISAVGQFDLYGLFIEKSVKLLNTNSKFGFITSNTYLSNKDFLELRRYLFENVTINEITNLGETVFTDANLDVAILLFTKQISNNNVIKITLNNVDFENNTYHFISQNRFNSEKNNFEIKLNSSEKDFDLIDKIFENKTALSEVLDLPRGIELGSNSDKIKTENQSGFHKLLVGKDISKYAINFAERYIKFEQDKSVFKDLEIYEQPKILIQRIRNLSLKTRIVATLDTDNYLCTNTLRIGVLKNKNFDLKFILAILNSKIINWIFSKYFLNKDIYAYQLDRLPIPELSIDKQLNFRDLVTKILDLNKEIDKQKSKFINRIISNYNLQKISKNLSEFDVLNFSEFTNELKKNKIKISLKQQDELEEYFNENKNNINSLINQSLSIENQIDKMVNEIYGLTEKEIELIENY